jgi:hypothetical protein
LLQDGVVSASCGPCAAFDKTSPTHPKKGNYMFALKKLASISLLAGFMSIAAGAQELPGKHPGYLHALSDLREARWLLNHQPGDVKVYADEDVAITELNEAIADIKRAAIDDGKSLEWHPEVDVREHGSRLLRSIEALKKARENIAREEDNPEVRELRRRAYEHIERATHAAERAHKEWLREVR